MNNLSRTVFSPAQIARLAQGELLIQGSGPIRSLTIDSRQVRPGALFIPLKGERVDGHSFLDQALQLGSAAVLVSRGQWEKRKDRLTPLLHDQGSSLIVVPEPLPALQRMARNHLRTLSHIFKIGITGSNGKTTTKEIIGAILRKEAATVISQGNLNTVIGLPLSVLRLSKEDKYAVFELGMNQPGEMDILVDIFKPDLALITNIGSAHIGYLGSQEAIAREKKKIFTGLDDRGRAFLYEEEKFFDYLSQGVEARVIPFGPRSTKGFKGSEDLGLGGTAIHWEGLQIRFPLFGRHNLQNALAAISVSAELGINKRKIKQGLEGVQPLFGRSQIFKDRVSVIQDCYNSNPDAMRQVLDFLKSLSWKGRKIAVLGGMLELGGNSEQAHHQIGLEIDRSGFDHVFLFGPEWQPVLPSLGWDGRSDFEWTEDVGRLRDQLIQFVQPGDLVLLKGSRGAAMERLLPVLVPSSKKEVEG